MSHEGSFFPVNVLRAFVRCALPGSPFEAGLREPSQPSACPCCEMFLDAGVTNRSSYRMPDGGGSCGFVEYLLPTFVWQHYAHLIPHSSPPTVLRYWGALGAISNLSESLRFTAGTRIAASDAPRVPASRFEVMVALIRASEGSGYAHMPSPHPNPNPHVRALQVRPRLWPTGAPRCKPNLCRTVILTLTLTLLSLTLTQVRTRLWPQGAAPRVQPSARLTQGEPQPCPRPQPRPHTAPLPPSRLTAARQGGCWRRTHARR